jgi:predicted transposase/invertase (TIGR01784 family)
MQPLPLENPITEIEYLPAELLPYERNSKLSIVGVRCSDMFGRHFIVEMQMAFQPFLHKRMLYNDSKVLSRQLSESQQYDEIGNVYTLCFIDEVLEKGIDDWFHHYIINHKKYPGRQMHGMEWFFIELGKWKKNFNFNQREKQSLWLMSLTQPSKILEMMTTTELAEFNEIRDALDIVNASKYTEGQINAMEKYLDEVRSYHSGISYAKKEGIKEGVEIDIEKGVEIGIEKGLETAYKNMVNIIIDIKAGISLDQIALKYNIEYQSVVDISNSIKVGL